MPTTTHFDPAFTASAFQARTDSGGAPVTDVDGPELRLPWSAFSAGIVGIDSYEVNAVSGMNIAVGSGVAFSDLAIVEGETAAQGKYGLLLEPTTQAITISAADLTNPRVDEIYLVVVDNPGTLVKARIAYRRGDPAASPANPGLDSSWDGALLLARVAVAAGASSISQGNITDMRPLAAPTNDDARYLPIGGGVLTGDLLPDGDANRDLGDATNTWRRVYAHEIWDETGVEAIDTGQKRLVGQWNVEGSLVPTADLSHDLGTDTLTWRRVYTQSLYNENGVLVANLNLQEMRGVWHYGDVLPIAGADYDLGDTAERWRFLYTKHIDIEGNNLNRMYRQTATGTTQILSLLSDVGGAATQRAYINAAGDIYSFTGVFGTISDHKLKTNIRDARGYLDDLRKLQVRKFNILSLGAKDQLGVVAQEVQEVFPGLVGETEDGTLTVKSSLLQWMMLKAIQELADIVAPAEA